MGDQNTQSKKRKVTGIPLYMKLKAISDVEDGISQDVVAEAFNVHVKTLKGWLKNKDNLRKWQSEHHDVLSVKRKRLRKPTNNLVDEAVWLWFQEKRSAGCPPIGPLIREQALRFYAELGGAADFAATDGWLSKWKVRHGVRCSTMSGEKLAADVQGAEEYREKFAQIIEDEDLGPDQLFNADETGLNFKRMPWDGITETLSVKIESGATDFKCQRERVTVMACSNASGSLKLPLVLIGKFKNTRAIKNLSDLPVSYKNQKSAWMTSSMFADWFHQEFVPAVTHFLASKDLPSKAILFVDNCSSHPQNLSANGIRVEFLPPNTTSLIQPMDQGCLQNLKLIYRKKLMGFVLDQLNNEIPLASALKKLSIREVILWIAEAWSQVSKGTIMNSWKQLYADIERVVMEDLSMDEPQPGSFGQNAELLRSRFRHFLDQSADYQHINNVDIEAWLQARTADDDILNVAEILQVVQEEYEIQSDTVMVEAPQEKKVTLAEAREGLDTALQYCLSSSHCPKDVIQGLYRVQDYLKT